MLTQPAESKSYVSIRSVTQGRSIGAELNNLVFCKGKEDMCWALYNNNLAKSLL
jgi:hypothetical protein